jgi:hypothetical protein
MTIADERSQNPPTKPITPYSDGFPLLKTLMNPIIIPNNPPKKKIQVRTFKIDFSMIIYYVNY